MSRNLFGDLALELRAMHENMLATGPRTGSLPELLVAAADEIEELRAGFSAATRGMDHKTVFDLITNAKKYVAERRHQNNS